MNRLVLSYICTAAAIVPALLIARFVFGLRPKAEMIVRDAMRDGRIAEASLVSKRAILRTPGAARSRDRRDRWAVRYVYTVGGREYRFTGIAESFPANRVTLYYPPGHPEKAIPAGSDQAGARVMIWFPIMAGVFLFFYWVVFSV